MPSESTQTIAGDDTPDANYIPFTKVPSEIHKRTGVRPDVATVYRWRARGRIAAIRLGGRVYVEERELQRFIDSGRTQAKAAG